MDKPRKFIDIVIPFNNEYLNLQILLPKILKFVKKIKYFKKINFTYPDLLIVGLFFFSHL